MEKRTDIYLSRHPSKLALALDRTLSHISNKPRKYAFDGYVTSEGFTMDKSATAQDRDLRLAVETNKNGEIPRQAYDHLVDALKQTRTAPQMHPIRVVYDRGMQIEPWHLELSVKGIDSLYCRRAA